ncbi:MAG: 50S ribosomal protein L32e [Crenarchaeota archaeon]|nr:50S ribosomal protein L32e [Thermoproteota archaeon]
MSTEQRGETAPSPDMRAIASKLRLLIKMKRDLPREQRRLLKLRMLMERREPKWMRMDEWRFWKIARQERWRRPKTLDNKIRHQRKGYPPMVKIGYRQPRSVRGLHPSGFETVRVFRPEDLEKIDPSRQAVIIASTVSKRKRLEIIRRAMDRRIKVINITYRDMMELLGASNVEEVKKLLQEVRGE